MRVFYAPDHVLHNPPEEIYDGVRAVYAERADRAEAIITRLRQEAGYDIRRPRRFAESYITAVHHPQYVAFLRRRSAGLAEGEVLFPSYFMTDTYAPITAGTYRAARRSVDTALAAAEAVVHGQPYAYGLCRPPGHHAEHISVGGYCYFNNAAIAAEYLVARGKVAILDIDFHHGNGTQHSFADRADVLYVSLHADPRVRYPYISGFRDECGTGPGQGFTLNYPLPLGTGDHAYLRTLRRALRDIERFSPDYLVVSAGFDTYAEDPIGGFALTTAVYEEVGQAITGLGLPTVILQEGGYNVEALGEMAHRLLQGFRARTS